jgi:UDP-glucose 6-dehydrogenase
MKADGSQDFSYYREFFARIRGYDGVIVVKSTVLLSDIEPYFKEFNIVMNPEFLNQNSSHEDFKNQKIVILGGRTDLCLQVKEHYLHDFYLSCNEIEYFLCTADEAIHIKYTHNIYHAYKVLFWNYVHETFGNHRKLFKAYSKITGNTFEMSNICSDGRPGYGGACFPKDVAAANSEKPHVLTQFMINYNKKIRGDSET